MLPLKLHQIRYLVAIAQQGSIRSAARELGVTQAAVTQAARELETQCELPLFIRHSSGIGLTPAGRSLLQHAQIIVEQLASADAEMIRYRNAEAAVRLSVGVTPWVAQSLLPAIIQTFHRELPNVQLELFEGLSAVAVPKLREGALDLLIGRTSGLPRHTDLQTTPVFSYEATVAARAGHPRARARSLGQLLECDWLLNYAPQEETLLLNHLFVQHGYEVPARRIHLAHSASLVLELVSRTDMLTFCPWPLLESGGGHGVLVPFHLKEAFAPHEVGIVRRRHDTLSWAAQRFLDYFFDQVRAGMGSRDPALRRVFKSVDVLL